MRKWIIFSSLFLLSGCSLDPDSADQYVAEEKLDAEIDVSAGHIQIATSPGADVSVSFWPEGGQRETLPMQEGKDGVFTAQKRIIEKGIYFVKADIQTNGQHIMPTKKIWVGVEADVEQNGPSVDMKHHH
ncbi:hypothetical protein L2D08_00470 [Domibacillus sp. PGB-M46]|uniref:hypothetical protein n=1 Tax=Domibacillus sp. PGB-M46 TaxID=2910255 RepID=UPI001F56FD59|nr:hypothetical protein [Domibacillus sp. PGB-M46]MCI2252833.1 hypothetical protein [Domibacillus sp. PGB-M46]